MTTYNGHLGAILTLTLVHCDTYISVLNYVTLFCTTLHFTTFDYYSALHYITLYYTTIDYTSLHYIQVEDLKNFHIFKSRIAQHSDARGDIVLYHHIRA